MMTHGLRAAAFAAALCFSVIRAGAQTPVAGTPATIQAKSAQPAHDPILVMLAQSLHAAFRREGLSIPVRLEEDRGMVTAAYHVQHVRVYLLGKDGREAARPSDLVAPQADGMQLQLQIEAADFVGQAVRPQTIHASYRTAGGTRAKWITSLDQQPLNQLRRSLLINLDYGARANPRWLDAVQRSIKHCRDAFSQR